jgi:RNA polymerase sigma-70 factor (ECF subfamily)
VAEGAAQMQHDQDGGLDQFTRGLIRRKARQLLRRPEFGPSDEDDLRQELITRLLERLPHFDPRISHRNVFVTTVIERSAATLVRNARAQKRYGATVCSLNSEVEVRGEGTAELVETLGEHEHRAHRGQDTRDENDLISLRLDVRETLESLPEDLRKRAERLVTSSNAQAARDLGISRSAYTMSVRQLRSIFESAGLRHYLKSRDGSSSNGVAHK